MRLIDADELADMLSSVRRKLDPKIYKTATEFYTRDEMLLNLEQMVRAAHTIDPVKRGRWEDLYELYEEDPRMEQVYRCSCCKEDFYFVEGNPNENLCHYCPKCGANMEGEEVASDGANQG